jgi:hypothetical protein
MKNISSRPEYLLFQTGDLVGLSWRGPISIVGLRVGLNEGLIVGERVGLKVGDRVGFSVG